MLQIKHDSMISEICYVKIFQKQLSLDLLLLLPQTHVIYKFQYFWNCDSTFKVHFVMI